MKKYIVWLFVFFFSIHLQAQQELTLFFDFNKAEINATSKAKLDSLFTNKKNIQITKIHGFADKIDNSNYNDSLSLQRANKVYQYCIVNKITQASAIEIKGFGENFKQSENQNINRKVIVFYTNKMANKPKASKGNSSEISKFGSNQNELLSFDLANAQQTMREKFNKAKKGDFIILENLYFQINSELLIKESEPILLTLLEILESYPKLSIQINGHICCNRNANDVKLSYRRAKFLFDYLIKNGIPTSRLGYRGYGSARPLYKMPEKSAEEEQANRRIEIEIIKK